MDATPHSPLGRIDSAGRQVKVRRDEGATHRQLGRFAVVYVYEGAGRFEDELGFEATIQAGDLIVLFPEVRHTYYAGRGGWREYYLIFGGPVFDCWRERGVLDPTRPVVHLEPIDAWRQRFESVLGAGSELDEPIVEVGRLQLVLAEALSQPRREAPPAPDRAWAQRACELLDTAAYTTGDLERIAEQMGTSYPSFRRRFAKVMGVPPGRYRAQRRIDRACSLMQQTDLTDHQIADALGFCDEFHFSRRFKQIVGRPPREYRRRLP